MAESAAEANVDVSELAGIVLGGVIKDPPLRMSFDPGWNAPPAGMGL
jgi:hypothetical protein